MNIDIDKLTLAKQNEFGYTKTRQERSEANCIKTRSYRSKTNVVT
jgi:hypothetical protein